jgi:hypothetical protein
MDTGQSPLRSLMADANAVEYKSFASLEEAKLNPKGIVVLEGDDGGQIYLVAFVSNIRCSEEILRKLHQDIDAREWPKQPDMAFMCFEVGHLGMTVPGGMGGGLVTNEPWTHPRLIDIRSSILAVLSGESLQI